MLAFVVMVLMIGVLAGAVAREVAAEPPQFGDVGPWLFGIVGSAIGGAIGLVAAGGDASEHGDQLWAVVGSTVGAALAGLAYVALQAKGEHDVETNTDTRQRTPAVDPSQPSTTGAGDRGSGATSHGS